MGRVDEVVMSRGKILILNKYKRQLDAAGNRMISEHDPSSFLFHTFFKSSVVGGARVEVKMRVRKWETVVVVKGDYGYVGLDLKNNVDIVVSPSYTGNSKDYVSRGSVIRDAYLSYFSATESDIDTKVSEFISKLPKVEDEIRKNLQVMTKKLPACMKKDAPEYVPLLVLDFLKDKISSIVWGNKVYYTNDYDASGGFVSNIMDSYFKYIFRGVSYFPWSSIHVSLDGTTWKPFH